MRRTLLLLTYIVVLIAMPCTAALLRVYVRQECLDLGYRLSVQQQLRDTLRAEVRKAELERARGRAPAQLMEMAKRLHLGPPRMHTLPPPRAKVPKNRAQPH